jgi:hypothetical protein
LIDRDLGQVALGREDARHPAGDEYGWQGDELGRE